jgi:two-component system, NarL family, nitrate/nitrite response regulator NarL
MTAAPPRVTVRVAIQSSRRLHRDTLATCLAARPDLSVVGNVAEPDELPALCELARPDTVILDTGPALGEYVAFVDDLLGRFPRLRVVMIYREASAAELALLCRAGVTSLVPESHGLAGVLALLRPDGLARPDAGQGGLSDRERELVLLTSSGHSVAEIALLLGLSPLTIENLKRRLYAKLGVNSSAQAVSKAASLGMLDRRATRPAATRPTATGPTVRPASGADFPVLTIVSGPECPARDQVVHALLANNLPFVLTRGRRPLADAHWASWHRGPILATLINPDPADWDLVEERGLPAIVVHSEPLDSAELGRAFASGANSVLPADRIGDHFLAVLRMVSQGYLVIDSVPMRSLMRGARGGDLPELTAREGDILRSVARGDSIRQTARALGISPKTVENIQTRLFRKLGVRNRAEALAVGDALGLLSDTRPASVGSGA